MALLSELSYLILARTHARTLDMFLQDLENGSMELDCGPQDIGRIRQLMSRYANLPLSLPDAAAIACAERNGGLVLSFDRDFWIVSGEGTITVVPPR